MSHQLAVKLLRFHHLRLIQISKVLLVHFHIKLYRAYLDILEPIDCHVPHCVTASQAVITREKQKKCVEFLGDNDSAPPIKHDHFPLQDRGNYAAMVLWSR